MKRGKTEVETLDLNGWKVGDILEGTESSGNWSSTDQLIITGIGETQFLCKWRKAGQTEWHKERGSWTLSHREWRKVS